jgi:hypothetical protein
MSYYDKRDLVNAASAHLTAVVALHQPQLDKGLSARQKNEMLMSISKLDRLIAAESAPYKISTISKEDLCNRYKTKVSKDIASKWLNVDEPQMDARGRKEAVVCFAAPTRPLLPACFTRKRSTFSTTHLPISIWEGSATM